MHSKNFTVSIAVAALLICVVIPDLRGSYHLVLPPVLNTLVVLQSSEKDEKSKNSRRHQE
ncbi:MAG: hypothetical protein KME21_07480 [Desmonostoc vinosum HA7617-LM4]|jgi:hypothetical protein|nr:hypothetical protein [Desmonostoc vinosum HA7617-LM4]